jgi:hypothetical protein
MRLITLLGLCAILSSASPAQTSRSKHPPAQKVTAPVTADKEAKREVPKVKEEYDKFKDKTRISLFLSIPAPDDATLKLYVTDASTGEKYVPSEFVGFGFMSKADSLFSKSADNLYILIDGGERHVFSADYVSGGSRLALIPWDTFKDMTKAKKVEGKIGILTFTLSDEQMEALRDFAAHAQ